MNENKREKKILENNKNDIKNNYENYLNSNKELNNYCNMTFPVSIVILNEYEKKMIQMILLKILQINYSNILSFFIYL